MTLTEFVTTHNLDLVIQFSNYTEKWYATIPNADIKIGAMLHGCGTDHFHDYEMCLPALAEKIAGKTLVKKYSNGREEFKVPKSITE